MHKYFEVFKWLAIVLAMVIFTTLFLVFCRMCCLRKVKVDPMGMSLKDLTHPSGSIVLTKELQDKIEER